MLNGVRFFITIAAVTVTAFSCSDETADPEITCDGVAPTFSQVNQIIQRSCQAQDCHNSGSFNGPGALLTYTQIFNARNGIRTAVSTGRMPENATLSAAEKQAIICWIDNGAPNN